MATHHSPLVASLPAFDGVGGEHTAAVRRQHTQCFWDIRHPCFPLPHTRPPFFVSPAVSLTFFFFAVFHGIGHAPCDGVRRLARHRGRPPPAAIRLHHTRWHGRMGKWDPRKRRARPTGWSRRTTGPRGRRKDGGGGGKRWRNGRGGTCGRRRRHLVALAWHGEEMRHIERQGWTLGDSKTIFEQHHT